MRYRRSIVRISSFTLMAWAWMLCASGYASAQPRDALIHKELITIDLDSKVEEFPSDVCVISELKSSSSQPLEPREPVAGSSDSWLQQVWKAYRAAVEKSDAGKPDSEKKLATLNTGDVLSVPSMSGDPCERNQAFCSPDFIVDRPALARNTSDGKKSDAYFIECSGNKADKTLQNKVVVLQIYGVSTNNKNVLTKPFVTDLNLTKNKVVFNLNYLKMDADLRTYAFVSGGHYAESEVRAVENKKVKLPLTPRCEVRELVLPSYAGSAKASVFLRAAQDDSEPVNICGNREVGANRSIRVALPYKRSNHRRTVRVETGQRGKWDFQSYSGDWYDFAPPPSIALRQQAISFEWKRHCMYPKTRPHITNWLQCPNARLIESDQDMCELRMADNVNETCYYTCESRSHTFDLPAHVRFKGSKATKLDTLSWTDEVRYGNQVLDAYVPPSQRHVLLDFSRWNEGKWTVNSLLTRRAAALEKIKFVGTEGKPHYYVFKVNDKESYPNEIAVEMAGAECGHVLNYQFIGDRTHQDKSVSIEDGRIVLDSPRMTEDQWKIRIYGGIGFFYPVYAAENVRDPWKVAAIAGAGLYWRPFVVSPFPGDLPFAIEGRYSAVLSVQDYFPLRPPSDLAPTRSADHIWYVRHILDGIFMLIFDGKGLDFHLGLGGGFIIGTPVFLSDIKRAGGLDFALSNVVQGQFKLDSVPRFTLDTIFRPVLFEDGYIHTSDFKGDARARSVGGARLNLELRLGYTL